MKKSKIIKKLIVMGLLVGTIASIGCGNVTTKTEENNGNDEIVINLAKKESQNIAPEKINLDIVYEDKDIIVINKAPNMVVHPTKRYQSGTLANGLLYYFKESKQDCIVRLVSRLDMDTSGLIIVAKNQYAHSELSNQMQNNNVEKRYLALVHGNFTEKKEI